MSGAIRRTWVKDRITQRCCACESVIDVTEHLVLNPVNGCSAHICVPCAVEKHPELYTQYIARKLTE